MCALMPSAIPWFALLSVPLLKSGAREESWPVQLLENASRQDAAPIAPAHGLTLESVSYPDEAEWSAQVHRTRRIRGFAFDGSVEEWAMGGNCCAG